MDQNINQFIFRCVSIVQIRAHEPGIGGGGPKSRFSTRVSINVNAILVKYNFKNEYLLKYSLLCKLDMNVMGEIQLHNFFI